VQRRGGCEVVRQVGQQACAAGRTGGLERLGDSEVQLGPPQDAQAVIQSSSHELVGETVRE
jgi:hypothetical protein